MKICLLTEFRNNENGATSIEYAMIGVIVSVGIIGSLEKVLASLTPLFAKVADAFP